MPDDLLDREVPAQIQGLVVDVANAYAQIVNEVMRFASQQSDGGPGGHTIAVVCIAACEMVINLLTDHYAKNEEMKSKVREVAIHILDETMKGTTVTVNELAAPLPN